MEHFYFSLVVELVFECVCSDFGRKWENVICVLFNVWNLFEENLIW